MGVSQPFVLHDPLPKGRLSIEASAGTGKTYALSTLAARYVVEWGIPVSELLIVTFTRAAAAELKDRVRARLVDFAQLLAKEQLTANQADDPLASMIWDVSRDERSERRQRAEAAVMEFDNAVITTIHGFASQALRSFGSAVPVDPDAVLFDDAGELVIRVATDLFVKRAINAPSDAEFPDLDKVVKTTLKVLGNPGAVVVPDSSIEPVSEIIDAICVETLRRRRRAGMMSYDDILVRLRDALDASDSGVVARGILRNRFKVALIDEFQDTDPVQWEIFDAVFDPQDTVLVIVGDPKQAIYAFRGANVHTYLQAAHAPSTEQRDMDTNWRSDPGMLDALEVLLKGTTFGDEAIGFQPVRPAPTNVDRSLKTRDGERHPTLAVRLMDGSGLRRNGRGDKRLAHGNSARFVYRDLAAYLQGLFDTLSIPEGSGSRELQPDDVAVLVTTGAQAQEILRTLTAAEIPAVIARGDSVMRSEAAQQWHTLLAAMARPGDTRRARAFALGWFGGRDASWAVEADDVELGEVQEKLRSWGGVLVRRGVAAFIGHLRADTGVVGRIVSRADGDRAVTDLDHIGELLVQAAPARITATALLALYTDLATNSNGAETETDLAARRVESDASAVQIMTVYTSKGLEFPVVCVPTMWSMGNELRKPNIWWDHERGARVIDAASDKDWTADTTRAERKELAWSELIGTDLRLLYVALTRARHHTAVWWLPTQGAMRSGLARVLFARDANGVVDSDAFNAAKVQVPFGKQALDALNPLVRRADGAIAIDLLDGRSRPPDPRGVREGEQPARFEAATLKRELERDRRRWSFTSIIQCPGTPDFGDGFGGGFEDEAMITGDSLETSLPLGAVPGGTGFGNLVHSVFEHVDFAATDLEAEIRDAVDEAILANPWDVDRHQLVKGLASVIQTPLGPMFGGSALRNLARVDRLDELSFELTLARSGTVSTARDVGNLLVDGLVSNDPMRDWAEHLASGMFDVNLAGHLTGSVDLLARVRQEGEPDRYVVCDYKTNRLGATDKAASGSDYHPGKLVGEVAKHHYALQALLYSVVVHRYLRWRVTDYDPTVHLGGIGYLFIRGMVGPDTPTHDGAPDGLFEWHPPVAVITGLSDLLDGGVS